MQKFAITESSADFSRNELYSKKHKKYFSKKEYQFNGFVVA